MPIGELFGGILSAAIPGIGAASAANLQRRWALQDLERQNIYNSPAEQLKRLRDAGLPAAAFFSSGASSQSDQPRSVNVDPTLGAAQGVNNFFTNRLQQAQIRAMEAQIANTQAQTRSANADADIKESARDFELSNWDASDDRFQKPLFNKLQTERRKLLAEAELAEVRRDIERITASYKNDMSFVELERNKEELNRVRASIKETLSRNDLLREQFTNMQHFTSWQHRVISEWEKSGGKVSTIELLLERLLYGGRSPFIGTH